MKISCITVCDEKYLASALALYRSLRKTGDYSLGIYSLDEFTGKHLTPLNLPGMKIFSPRDYIPADILRLQATRSAGAFAFTVKSLALLHALRIDPLAEWTSYFDVDIWFFSDPGEIFKTLPPRKSACFTPHRFSTSFQHYESAVGHYNAGHASFRNNIDGRKVLEHWRDLCSEWCHDYTEKDRYGDQKYLNLLAKQYDSVDTCNHKGANTAPWNVADAKTHTRNGQVFIDDDPLLFYHFQGLKTYGPRLFDLYASPELIISGDLLTTVYAPYIKSLHTAYCELMATTSWHPTYTHYSWRIRFHNFIKKILGERTNLYRI